MLYNVQCVFCKGLVCPVIYTTPYQRVSCPAGHSYGASCYFNCTSEKNVTGAQAVSSDSYGYPPVTYWKWGLAQPKCARYALFQVIVTVYFNFDVSMCGITSSPNGRHEL